MDVSLATAPAPGRPNEDLVCTDEVSRLVEHFGWTWPEVLELAGRAPLRDLLRAVRAAEAPGPPPGSTKRHDDATVARCLL